MEEEGVLVVEDKIYKGSCLCQAVSFTAKNVDKNVWYCHCIQCRKISGNYVGATRAKDIDIKINGKFKWFYVNDSAKHGFCPKCGSELFWKKDGLDTTSIFVGALDDSKGLSETGHIFVKEKADCFTFNKKIPCYDEKCS